MAKLSRDTLEALHLSMKLLDENPHPKCHNSIFNGMVRVWEEATGIEVTNRVLNTPIAVILRKVED